MGRQMYRDIPGPYSTDPQPKMVKGKPKVPAKKPLADKPPPPPKRG
jgi:hypothetical protein